MDDDLVYKKPRKGPALSPSADSPLPSLAQLQAKQRSELIEMAQVRYGIKGGTVQINLVPLQIHLGMTQKEIFKALPFEKTPNFNLSGQFLTIDNKEIKDYEEVWGVNLFAIDVNDFIKKGNLIMSLDDGKGNVIYYRLLKKID